MGTCVDLRADLNSMTKRNEDNCPCWELNSNPQVSILLTTGSFEVLRVKDTISWNVMSCILVVPRTEESAASIFRVVKCRRRGGELWILHLIMKDTEKRNSGFECEISRIGKRCDPED
jgi:hypothetical protein